MELVFATNNKNKVKEVAALLEDKFKLYTLAEINCYDEIEETENTIEGNAVLKAEYVRKKFNYDCFADDTGLEIETLGGRPGVFSARYAGEACSAAENMKKVLQEMKGISNRKARFRTVIALKMGEDTYMFEGVVNGTITQEHQGKEGFGYDPIFLPENNNLTFAEMPLADKNAISHRGKAVQQLVSFLGGYRKDS
jgi:XTP/dITP diphosphohydrolase